MSALVLHERAVEHCRAGRHRAAERDLRAALSRTDDRDLLARIRSTQAWILALEDDGQASVAILTELLEEQGLREETVATLHAQLGGVLSSLAEGGEALRHLDLAVAGLADDPLRLMAVLFNRAGLWVDRGEYAAAAADYERAAEVADRGGSPWHAAAARHNQGTALAARGDLVRALQLMGAARPLIAEQSAVNAARADQETAAVLLAAGLPEEAAALLRNCVAVFKAHRVGSYRADAELSLARTIADQNPREAIGIARRAATSYDRIGSTSLATRARVLVLTIALASGRATNRHVSEAQQLLPSLTGDDVAGAGEELLLALELHHVRKGKPWPRTPALREDASIVSRLAEAEVRVEVAARTGHDAEALDRAREGIRLLREWQSSTDSLELRSSLAMHGYRMVEQAAAVAMRTADPALHFEWSERSRGFVAASTPLIDAPPPDSAKDAELEALRGLLAIGEDLDGPQVAQVRDRIRRRQWARERASRISVDIASLDETCQMLRDRDATLVSFLSDPRKVSVLVASADGCRVVPIATRAEIRADLAGLQADLDMSSADLRPTLAALVRDGLRRRLDHLSSMLWAPIESEVRTRRVVITAPAALAAVPWSLMTPLRDRSITVPLSVTQWLRHTATDAPLRSVGFITGPGVPRAGTEVAHAAKQWPGATVVDAASATTASMRELTRNTDLLHVAAHGRHTPGNPMFSGLELLDGPWFGHDVAELTMVPSVVVLSACELGRSTARWGEETIGMARAWLHSGVRCVIAAPCTVNDAATSDYLAAVHSGLAGGLSPSDALLAADPDERAPFLAFGAGF